MGRWPSVHDRKPKSDLSISTSLTAKQALPPTSLHLLTPSHTYSHLFTHLHTSSQLFTPLHTSSHLFTPLHTYSQLFTTLHTSSHFLTLPHTSSHLLVRPAITPYITHYSPHCLLAITPPECLDQLRFGVQAAHCRKNLRSSSSGQISFLRPGHCWLPANRRQCLGGQPIREFTARVPGMCCRDTTL